MLGTYALGCSPLSAAPRPLRAFRIAAVNGEYGWAAWSYSRQAKLNTWAWHGIGPLGGVNSWATLGNALYLRGESDNLVYVMQPDTFYAETDQNVESTSVEATTQWLDFGKPGLMKALSGMDMDVQGITAVEIFGFVPNPAAPRDRTPTLLATIPIGDAETGWTYNGEIIPLEEVGAATEFMLRFLGDANQEVQINRMTLYWEPVHG